MRVQLLLVALDMLKNYQITVQITNLFEVRQDKNLMRILYSLTLRGYSEMRMSMHTIWGDAAKECKIVLARLNRKVVGWSLAHQYPEGLAAHFYVARNFRRKGIGTILYNCTKELCKKDIYCSSWDKISASFFIKNKAKIYSGSVEHLLTSDSIFDTIGIGGIMKRTKAPIKPRMPTKPNEYLPVTNEHYSIYDGTSLSDILAAVNGIDPEKVKFVSTRGYYDDYDYQFEWPAQAKRNPNYNQQILEYEKKMQGYQEDITIYNEKLITYNAAQKEYLKWHYEKELKKLNVSQ